MNNNDIMLKANNIRRDIILMLNKAKSGHSAGAIGLSDIFAVLYFDVLKHNPKNPTLKTRDFVILSNGHVCPVLYATLANCGYFSKEELLSLRELGSKLQGHPHNGILPGIENSSGPLGQGISQAVGLAASLMREEKSNRVYCFVGDGELEEGQVWEALMFAAKEKLNNLVVIVDRNYIQIDGNTEDVCALDPLSKKLSAFNWMTIEFDGNNISQIKHAFKHAKDSLEKPVCLIANTIPGKSISFMENDYRWHGKAPNDKEKNIALEELDDIEKKIKERMQERIIPTPLILLFLLGFGIFQYLL